MAGRQLDREGNEILTENARVIHTHGTGEWTNQMVEAFETSKPSLVTQILQQGHNFLQQGQAS